MSYIKGWCVVQELDRWIWTYGNIFIYLQGFTSEIIHELSCLQGRQLIFCSSLCYFLIVTCYRMGRDIRSYMITTYLPFSIFKTSTDFSLCYLASHLNLFCLVIMGLKFRCLTSYLNTPWCFKIVNFLSDHFSFV